jgi:hypothetical protein
MPAIRPIAFLLCALISAPTAQASAQLALDYARYQGQTEMEVALANKLRAGHLFGGIQAHEQLSEKSACALVRWIIQGAK